MIAKAVTSWKYFDDQEYTVEISHGVQHFLLNYKGTRAEAEWMAKVFNHALKMHDAQKLEEYFDF